MADYVDKMKVGNTTKDIQDTGARTKIGTLASLNTTEKGNTVGAVNEVLGDIGTLSNLTTTVKTSMVAAANEINASVSDLKSSFDTETAFLQTQIDEIIAPSGEAPSVAEVENARIGADGTVYNTLGNAIRTQFGELKDVIIKDAILIDDLSDLTLESNTDYFIKPGTYAVSSAITATVANVTIYGNGSVINNSNNSAVFNITGDNIEICDFVINNNKTLDGRFEDYNYEFVGVYGDYSMYKSTTMFFDSWDKFEEWKEKNGQS